MFGELGFDFHRMECFADNCRARRINNDLKALNTGKIIESTRRGSVFVFYLFSRTFRKLS